MGHIYQLLLVRDISSSTTIITIFYIIAVAKKLQTRELIETKTTAGGGEW
jgi:hypothetical protein